jgi:hypothetical protein
MANDTLNDNKKVALADAIAGLRAQILEAKRRASGLQPEDQFHIHDVEVELTVVAEGSVTAKGGVDWWIFKAGGEVQAKEALTHKVKFKLDVGHVAVGSTTVTN